MYGARRLATPSRTPCGLACGAARHATHDRATRGFRRLPAAPTARLFCSCAVHRASCSRFASSSACGHMWRMRRARGFHPRRSGMRRRRALRDRPKIGLSAVGSGRADGGMAVFRYTPLRYRWGGRRMITPRRPWCDARGSAAPLGEAGSRAACPAHRMHVAAPRRSAASLPSATAAETPILPARAMLGREGWNYRAPFRPLPLRSSFSVPRSSTLHCHRPSLLVFLYLCFRHSSLLSPCLFPAGRPPLARRRGVRASLLPLRSVRRRSLYTLRPPHFVRSHSLFGT
jgi:hypothetical protein